MKIIKDIVIPAGTEFEEIDWTTTKFIEWNYEAIVSLWWVDSTASFIINDDFIEEQEIEFE